MDTEKQTAGARAEEFQHDEEDCATTSKSAVWKDVPPEDKSDPVEDVNHCVEQVGQWKLFGASRRAGKVTLTPALTEKMPLNWG